MSPNEFWDSTFPDVSAYVDAASWRYEREVKRDTRLAWLTAALYRAKRMPSLKSMLRKASQKLSKKEVRELKENYDQARSAVDIDKINEIAKRRINSGI